MVVELFQSHFCMHSNFQSSLQGISVSQTIDKKKHDIRISKVNVEIFCDLENTNTRHVPIIKQLAQDEIGRAHV